VTTARTEAVKGGLASHWALTTRSLKDDDGSQQDPPVSSCADVRNLVPIIQIYG
jgi:hypothetical protein